MKVKFDFSPPVSYDEFVKEHSIQANSSGIYIWGFKSKQGDFIPYYVGRRYFTEKSPGSVYSRMISHYKGLTKKGTYMIFSKEFYDNIDQLSDNIKSEAKPYKNFSEELIKKLIYRNDKTFLLAKYGVMMNDEQKDEIRNRKNTSLKQLESMIGELKDATETIDQVFKRDLLFVSYACPTELKDGQSDFITIKNQVSQAETDTKFKLADLGYNVISDSKNRDENDILLKSINIKALKLNPRK